MVEIQISVSNYYKVLNRIRQLNDGEYYRGIFRDFIREELRTLAKTATDVTHRETGTLADSHTWEYDSHKMKGRVFIDPDAVKMSGMRIWGGGVVTPAVYQSASKYGVFEHERGGDHAFYEIALDQVSKSSLLESLKAKIEMMDI